MSNVTPRGLWFRTLAALGLAAMACPLAAQCTNQWLPGECVPGLFNEASSMVTWDPDGAGPLTPRIVVAAGGVFVWQPETRLWTTLGSGFYPVRLLATLPNGDLVAQGSAGGVTSKVARWDGTTWVTLVTTNNSNQDIHAMAAMPNGDLVVGGRFTSMGGVPANHVARWDGTSWSSIGAGTNDRVFSLAAAANGELIVGGRFTTAGGIPAANLARWNGAWSAMGTPPIASPSAILVRNNGNVVACGSPPTNAVASWDGAAWTTLGVASSGPFGGTSLLELPNGDLIVGGAFAALNGVPVANIARWNGTSWSPLGSGLAGPLPPFANANAVYALARLPNGDLFAAGKFSEAGNVLTKNVARWDGASWSTLGSGVNGGVLSLATLPNGDLVAAGRFTAIGSVTVNGIARHDGTSWFPLGPGLGTLPPSANALTVMPNGDLVVGGSFTEIGGVVVNNVARWDGVSWSPMGGGFAGSSVLCLTTLSNGDVVAGGYFGIRRWDGVAWTQLGSGVNGATSALLTMPNGDLVAGGGFTIAGGVPASCVARWDGSSWSALGSGILVLPYPNGPSVNALAVTRDGDLIVGGSFTGAGGVAVQNIARWNGASWSALGSGIPSLVLALTTLPNGDIVAGGEFTAAGGIAASRIARWDGTSWSAFGAGIGHWSTCWVNDFATLADGDLVVGGSFTAAGGQDSANIAWLTTTCPATVTTFGSGCAESNGPDVLTATTLPWIDATFRAKGTGLPTVALVFTLTSVTPIPQGAAPLTLAFPQAGPGCDVLTWFDLLGLLVTTNGTAESQQFLPSSPPLVGVPFYHQFVSIEVDPQGVWTSVTATNALQIVAGAF